MSVTTDVISNDRLCGIVVLGECGPLLQAVAVRLTAAGANVRFLTPPFAEPPAPYRLLVLRAKSIEATSWAKHQQQRGTTVVPDPRVIELIKDRWTCRGILQRAGMHLPDALLGTPNGLLTSGVKRMLPVVLKRRRVHGSPVRLIISDVELHEALKTHNEGDDLVAERFVDGVHYTGCFIGRRTYVFLKPPLCNSTVRSEPIVSPPAEVLECVEQYRAVSGLYFGKVDIVVPSSGAAVLVDAGVSPNLWMVSDAEELLSQYFLSLTVLPRAT